MIGKQPYFVSRYLARNMGNPLFLYITIFGFTYSFPLTSDYADGMPLRGTS